MLPGSQGVRLAAAAILSAIVLWAVGAARAHFLPRGPFRYGMEMFLIGAAAASAAYVVGFGVEAIVS
jgi:VIT1/CCC1 family predicted Fe2+/Mn2+ transporter